MADRRTLEELKVLLQGSHAAEQKLIDKKRRLSSNDRGSRERAIRVLNRLRGMETVTIQPLFGGPQEVLRPTERGYRRNPLERGRRKMLADYIRQIREEFPDPKQARAHILDALRADVELGKRTSYGFTRSIKNPLVSLIGRFENMPGEVFSDFAEEHFERVHSGDYYDEMDTRESLELFEDELELSSEEKVKKTNQKMDREVEKRRKEEIKEARDNRAFNRRNLRRTPNKELAALMALAIGDLDPVAGLSLTEELNQRAIDEANRGMSRRKMMARTAAQVAKPSLPTGPGPAGSGGEKVARTFLRLLTRGRTR